jgi:hypothetical protein
MSRARLWVLVLVMVAAGFVAGRLTGGPAVFQAGDAVGGDVLGRAWTDFLRVQQESLELYRSSDFFEDDQERAEAYRGLLYTLVGSIKAGALMDMDHPRFMRASDWTSKSGLDNPDTNYYSSVIRDDADYRIIGSRGSSTNMVFQLLVGQPGVAGAGSSTNVGVLYGSEMKLAEDGSFEVIISRENPGEEHNWLPNGDGAQTLLVRFTHSDWSRESPGDLRIEKIGAEGEAAVPLSPAKMARGLQAASASLFDRSASWLQLAERIWNLAPRNGVSPASPTRGGLVGQLSAIGTWELDNDQAIILSTVASAASYQGIELGSLWFVSLDYETRTSSLTLDQMHCSSDGRCYAVISHRDPGIQNWLDTEGHRRGLIFMRWQGLSTELAESQQPRARLVDFARLKEELPSDMPVFNVQQRREQIRLRRANLHQRAAG